MRDGIEDVHNLSLTALEIQMVRSGTTDIYPDEEDVGIPAKDLEGRFIIEIIRDDMSITDLNTPVEEDDILVQMPSAFATNFGELYEIGDLAKKLDVSVSLHTPNYIDLSSDSPLTDDCLNSIRHAALIENALGGDIVVTNLGLYSDPDDIDASLDSIYGNVDALMEWWKDEGLKPKLGIEITGQQEVFGSLEQVLDICHEFKGLVPVVNWPHYHSRTNGSLLEVEDFQYVIEQVEPYCKGHIHSLFAGAEHSDGNELRLTPIKKGDLKFETLAECLIDIRPDMTIISSSPLLEHDAMYMRIIHERYLSKKVAKALRMKKKEEATAEE